MPMGIANLLLFLISSVSLFLVFCAVVVVMTMQTSFEILNDSREQGNNVSMSIEK